VFIGPSSNLIILSLDDETLPIIHKPKHPPPKKKGGENKLEGFGVSSLQGEPTKYYLQPKKQQPYVGHWLHG
jgi:hypothetical protein